MRPVLTSLLLLGILTPWASAQQTLPGAPPAAPFAPAHPQPTHPQAAPLAGHLTPQQMAGRPARIGATGTAPATDIQPAAAEPATHKASPATLIVQQPGEVKRASHEIALKPTAPAEDEASLPLPAPTKDDIPLAPPSGSKKGGEAKSTSGSGPAITSMLGSLAIVVGLFLAVAWFARRAGGQSSKALPKEVVQVLGRTPLTSKQNLQVIRFGNKMLLVSVSAGGAETLAELTDGPEIDRIAGLCQQQGSESVTASFRQMMAQMSREPASRPAAAAAPSSASTPAARKPSSSSAGGRPAANSRAASAYTSTGR